VMADAVGKINRQIQGLAPVLNSPTVTNGATAIAVPDTVSAELARLLGPAPIAMMLRRHGNNTYLFAVRMEGKSARATFAVEGLPSNSTAEVLGEQREIAVRQGVFQDDFGPYAVHIYKIRQ